MRTLKRGLLLFGALGLAGFAAAELPTMTAEEAHMRVQRGELVLIDVRTPSEWAMTGVPQDSRTANMHDRDFLAQALGAVLGDLEQPVAVICKTGARSADAGAQLQKNGFKSVFNVREGMAGHEGDGEGWLKRGLPVDPFNPPDR